MIKYIIVGKNSSINVIIHKTKYLVTSFKILCTERNNKKLQVNGKNMYLEFGQFPTNDWIHKLYTIVWLIDWIYIHNIEYIDEICIIE